VAFPEIDVRQRLSVSTGYGVAELLVHTNADLVGKTIKDSGLWDRDITVLTLHRGTSVIPNPRSGVVLEPGDRLLCFGKLEEMRSMVPDRRRRRTPCPTADRGAAGRPGPPPQDGLRRPRPALVRSPVGPRPDDAGPPDGRPRRGRCRVASGRTSIRLVSRDP
jgi:hypothetical protein